MFIGKKPKARGLNISFGGEIWKIIATKTLIIRFKKHFHIFHGKKISRKDFLLGDFQRKDSVTSCIFTLGI